MRKLLLVGLVAYSSILVAGPRETALDRYVNAPDNHFSWKLVNTLEGKGYKAFVLDMTSQKWRTEKEVDRPIWKHWVTIYKPDTVKTSTGFLFITGGSTTNPKPPAKPDPLSAQVAVDTGAVAIELRMVPNQPLVFPDDGKPRTEDGIIAYTWDKFLRGGDEQWPLRLPMTKAAVRAMDAVTAFCATPEAGSFKVDQFVVSGGSKRGWTSWTTAAVDKRVKAVVPIVIDMLNMVPSFEHHWRVYGFWAPSIGDYASRGIMEWTKSKEYRKLMEIEEPFEYRDRLTMPKFIVNAAGDQFFIPDSSQFYWNELKGEKYLRYVPNADHGLGGSDAILSVIAYLDSVIKGTKRPEYSWKVEKNGDIRVKSKDKPSEVKVWMALNPEARDFRVEKVGRIYKPTVLTEAKPGEWIAKAPKVEKGFAAYFVELQYPSGVKYPYKFTTQVKVWPDTYPHAPYVSTKPMGTPAK
jgi:PhoPQ-activated pathogenicity-related protein